MNGFKSLAAVVAVSLSSASFAGAWSDPSENSSGVINIKVTGIDRDDYAEALMLTASPERDCSVSIAGVWITDQHVSPEKAGINEYARDQEESLKFKVDSEDIWEGEAIYTIYNSYQDDGSSYAMMMMEATINNEALNEIRFGRKIIIRDSDEELPTARFDLKGSNAAINSLLEACYSADNEWGSDTVQPDYDGDEWSS